MNKLIRWIRIVHRWLAVPFLTAIGILIVGSIQQGENFVSPGWLGVLGIGSILLLALTGTVMFVQHYLAKWRRAARSKQIPASAAD
jgi:hypothetical protein